jgi:hypothetical protein
MCGDIMSVRKSGYIGRWGKAMFVWLVPAVLLLCVLLSPGDNAASAAVAGASYTTSATRDDEEVPRDIGAKIDTAIAVLKVIRDEVREPLPGRQTVSGGGSGKGAATSADKAAEPDIDRIKAIGRRVMKIWRQIMASLGKAEEAGIRERKMNESLSDAARDLSEKMDSAIEAMRQAREELDEISGEGSDR